MGDPGLFETVILWLLTGGLVGYAVTMCWVFYKRRPVVVWDENYGRWRAQRAMNRSPERSR